MSSHTPVKSTTIERMRQVVRARLEVLRKLEKERNHILREVARYLSGKKAEHEKKIMAEMPYTPVKYE
ncbi:MAG: hypothetical protein KIH62_000270 [Candidatus Kerfeldbacteria bacterium]|nr:hypothetical protein [Candidatus Kerfeldbacteria bacterium]